MKPEYLTSAALDKFIDAAMSEDIGPGDFSTLSSIPQNAIKKAKLLVKDQGIIAGIELAQYIFKRLDPTLKMTVHIQDGSQVSNGDVAFEVEGPARTILTAERLVLNCMQRMSGIATLSKQYAQKLEGTNTKILDTRKTTPNARIIEKWAVHIGGGTNHRFGLYDLVMLKDNHVDYAGGIDQAIEKSVSYLKANELDLKIEVETRNLLEVKEVLKNGKADIIMLDNMSNDTMQEAVALIDGRMTTEASGGITLERIESIAACGVDFISVGALTHSYKSLDMSLKAF